MKYIFKVNLKSVTHLHDWQTVLSAVQVLSSDLRFYLQAWCFLLSISPLEKNIKMYCKYMHIIKKTLPLSSVFWVLILVLVLLFFTASLFLSLSFLYSSVSFSTFRELLVGVVFPLLVLGDLREACSEPLAPLLSSLFGTISGNFQIQYLMIANEAKLFQNQCS